MPGKIPPSLYWPDTQNSVSNVLKSGEMPAPFVRRMRVLNLISQAVLRNIDVELFEPFDTFDLSHILDQQISQDALIDQMASSELIETLVTGDTTPLISIATPGSLTERGLINFWLPFAFEEVFHPLNVLLAMRTKLMLDVLDELGHSYNLLKRLGWGWIDLGDEDLPGDIPGTGGGDPDGYVPPLVVVPPGGNGNGGDGTAGDGTAGDGTAGDGTAGDGTAGDGSTGEGTGFFQPGARGDAGDPFGLGVQTPGAEPGPGPGDGAGPGQGPGPGAPPGPAPPGPTPGPGAGNGMGAGQTAGPGVMNSTGPLNSGMNQNMAGPGGFGAHAPWPASTSSGGGGGGGAACCYDTTSPGDFVTIGYTTLEMDPSEDQNLSVQNYPPSCVAGIYDWEISVGGGSLASPNGTENIFTAPTAGGGCVQPCTIKLFCTGIEVDSITIAVNPCPVVATIDFTTNQMQVDEVQTLTANIVVAGCGTPTFDWSITSGGGSLSAAQGSSVDYTAPSTNPECANNATISLKCDGIELDNLQIAINATAPFYSHYVVWHGNSIEETPCEDPGGPTWGYGCSLARAYKYGCNDDRGAFLVSCGGASAGPFGSLAACLASMEINCTGTVQETADGCGWGTPVDVRTAQMITDGCCPFALF